MADTKISALTEATSAASTDLIAVVDVDDTTMASSGTTKRITKANLTSDLASSSHTHTLSDVTDSGTAAAKDVPSSGDASSTQVVMGDDSRLTEVTLTGTPDYITISGQEITRNQIDLTADVTGSLPDGNIASARDHRCLLCIASSLKLGTAKIVVSPADNGGKGKGGNRACQRIGTCHNQQNTEDNVS